GESVGKIVQPLPQPRGNFLDKEVVLGKSGGGAHAARPLERAVEEESHGASLTGFESKSHTAGLARGGRDFPAALHGVQRPYPAGASVVLLLLYARGVDQPALVRALRPAVRCGDGGGCAVRGLHRIRTFFRGRARRIALWRGGPPIGGRA